MKDQTNKFALAFSLIKGVLERANARQLKTIEYYSPVIFIFVVEKMYFFSFFF